MAPNVSLAQCINALPLPRCPRQRVLAAAVAPVGAKRAREKVVNEEGGSGASGSGASGGCTWRGNLGQLAAHRLTCPLEPAACAHCAAQFTVPTLAAHAAQGCPKEPVRCTVPGCTVSCTRAALAASTLGASHGPHVAALSAQLAGAEEDVQAGLCLLCILTDSSNNGRNRAGAAGVDAAVAALQHHTKYPRVREHACLLLSNLTDESQARAKHAGAKGAVQLVVAVLADGTMDAECHESACRALAHLSIDGAIASTAIAAVVSVLRLHPAIKNVQRFGGWSLDKMLHSKAEQDHAAAAGALDACLAALRAYQDDVNVQDTYCGVLMNLTHGHKGNACDAVGKAAIGLLLDALDAHGATDAELAAHASGALQNLFTFAQALPEADRVRAKTALKALMARTQPDWSEAADVAKRALAALRRSVARG